MDKLDNNTAGNFSHIMEVPPSKPPTTIPPDEPNTPTPSPTGPDIVDPAPPIILS